MRNFADITGSSRISSNSIWQLLMLILSILALVLLAVQTFGNHNSGLTSFLRLADTTICIIFFLDFLWQTTHTRPVSRYLKWGWLDLISSIPTFPVFRLVRITRILRIFRGARASKHILRFILVHRARNTFASVVFCSLVLLLFSVIAINVVEPIMTLRETFWWALYTIITGEYGNYYPTTTEGRIITVLLMTSGVALFGTFTASIASFFLEEDQINDERRDSEILQKIQMLTEQISELRKDLKGEHYGQHTQESNGTLQ